jgi:hypothetical protein
MQVLMVLAGGWILAVIFGSVILICATRLVGKGLAA